MEVTGLTVNEKLNVSRKELRRFRATLHQIERDGPTGKTWGNSPDVIAAIKGYANFVAMVDAEKGAKFQAQVHRIIEKYGSGQHEYIRRQRWQEPTSTQVSVDQSPQPVESTPKSDKPKSDKWWKFW